MDSTNKICSPILDMVCVSFYYSKKCALYIKMNTTTNAHFSPSIHDNRYASAAGRPYIATADARSHFRKDAIYGKEYPGQSYWYQ